MIDVSMLLEQYKEAIKFLHHTIKDKGLTPDEILEREDVHTKTANDRIHKAVMEVIGEDEFVPKEMLHKGGVSQEYYDKRNKLRQTQRQRANKFFGRVQP